MHPHGVTYNESDYLQLSGIQHFAFCRRQWALIHIEQQWAENYRTADGAIMHETAHSGRNESRGDLLIMRSVNISSASLGLSGQCDVLEFHKDNNGITLAGRLGKWLPYPIEYKRGEPKENDSDALQLCAQAMCLEEMLCCRIEEGALFYGETHRRVKVELTAELREKVRQCAEEMHALYDRGYTPKVKASKACNACSLKDICVPKLMKAPSVNKYLTDWIGGGEQ